MEDRRISGFSYLRVTACFAIVLLHVVFSSVLVYQQSIGPTQFLVSQITANCMMWAVPCFILISGALLLNEEKEVHIGKIFSKYIKRMVLALVLCSVLFGAIDFWLNGESVSLQGAASIVTKMLTGTGWSHLWYLYLMIGFYLLLPFYKKMVRGTSGKELIYLLVVYVIFLSIIPAIKKTGIDCGFYILVSTVYPFYFIAGHMIASGKVIIPIAAAWTTLIASTAAICAGTVVRWKDNLEWLDTLWEYSSVLVILQAMAIFVLFFNAKQIKCKVVERVVLSIDSCSFGLYLLHMIGVRIALRKLAFNPYEYGVAGFAAFVISIFILFYLIIWIGRKIGSLLRDGSRK